MQSLEEVFECPRLMHFITRRAGRLQRLAGSGFEDQEDFSQSLYLHLWQQISRFDPNRGSLEVFLKCLVRHASRNLLRDQFRTKRRPCTRPVPLYALAEVPSTQATPQHQWEKQEETQYLMGQAGLSIDGSPLTFSEWARLSGISRATLYRRIHKLKQRRISHPLNTEQ